MRFLSFSIILFFSCSTPETKLIELFFTSHGIVAENIDSEQTLLENGKELNIRSTKIGRIHFFPHEWLTSASYSIQNNSKRFQAPKEASPYLLTKIPLENADKLASSGNFPDSDLAFSSDNRLLAIATYFGYLRVYDISADKILWERKLSEGMVKKIHFSEKDNILFAGEQSLDGYIYAFNTEDGNELWKYRLADDLDESAPPKADNLYGIYSLPASFHIKVLDDDNVLIAGLHSWHDGKNFHKKSKLYSFTSTGVLNWTFPKKTLSGNIQYFDATQNFVTFSIGSLLKKEKGLQESSILLIDTKTGKLLDQQKIDPLKPHFEKVYFWQSISIDPLNQFVNMGTYDGRAFLFPIRNKKLQKAKIFNLGTPIFSQNIPIMAGISYTTALKDLAIYSINQSSIPYSYSKVNKISEPPSLHPASGSIVAYNGNAELKWKDQDSFVYSAIHASKNENWLLATIDDKKENRKRNYFGFSLFRRGKAQTFKKVYSYNSHVPAFFRGAISNSGLLKGIVTAPYIRKKGEKAIGKYEVHVVL